MNDLPFLSVTSEITGISHLASSDVDLNFHFNLNFKYYSPHDFHSDYDIDECSSNNITFSTINCNIRSLAANFDNFLQMLSDLNFSFSLTGLSETKTKLDKDPLTTTNIHGYYFVSQPRLSNAGGVAFYLKNNLDFTIRSNISLSEPGFKALWIEVKYKNQPNLLCGIIYGHPNNKIDTFLEYINLTIEKIHQEKKNLPHNGRFQY